MLSTAQLPISLANDQPQIPCSRRRAHYLVSADAKVGAFRFRRRHLDEPPGQTAYSGKSQGAGRNYAPAVKAFAIAEIGSREAVDVFLRREDAFATLAQILRDEPERTSVLHVVPIQLDERTFSDN
jgi:hypothetical protein